MTDAPPILCEFPTFGFGRSKGLHTIPRTGYIQSSGMCGGWSPDDLETVEALVLQWCGAGDAYCKRAAEDLLEQIGGERREEEDPIAWLFFDGWFGEPKPNRKDDAAYVAVIREATIESLRRYKLAAEVLGVNRLGFIIDNEDDSEGFPKKAEDLRIILYESKVFDCNKNPAVCWYVIDGIGPMECEYPGEMFKTRGVLDGRFACVHGYTPKGWTGGPGKDFGYLCDKIIEQAAAIREKGLEFGVLIAGIVCDHAGREYSTEERAHVQRMIDAIREYRPSVWWSFNAAGQQVPILGQPWQPACINAKQKLAEMPLPAMMSGKEARTLAIGTVTRIQEACWAWKPGDINMIRRESMETAAAIRGTA